ncbi:MAG: glutamate 5-kinase [Lachnospiraceae bacterium]|nr:glutamate 5-kinase [Lachnospiraceae bacterium]
MKIVVKIGTSSLTYKSGHLNIRAVEQLCKVLSDLKNAGNEIILVSSGAIAMGVGKLQLRGKPEDLPGKQAAAAVGQCELMYIYDKLFSEYNHTVGQILLTADDISDPGRFENFRNTINRLLEMKVLPIINENDTLGTNEIRIGDNDNLGAMVAVSVGADLMVILTDTDGLYTADPSKDPDSVLIKKVAVITPEIEALAGGTAGTQGTGGMATKVEAAVTVTEAGTDMVITNGKDVSVLYDIIEGRDYRGTLFCGRKDIS